MGKVYCCSDLHGEFKLFKQIQSFLKEDDICYILGDSVDRGLYGIEIIKETMKDKRFKMLLGNHERMLMDTWEEFLEGDSSGLYYYFMEGGRPTWESFFLLEQQEQCEIYYFLTHLPLRVEYKDKILSHAGYDFRLKDPSNATLLWDRSHIDRDLQDWGRIQVHGHTCVSDIVDFERDVLRYSPSKICIDIGAHFYKRTALLDLDSLECIYFKEDK